MTGMRMADRVAELRHENNFNLLRVLAAFGVLYSHSYALTDGRGAGEPFRAALGMSMGGIAVDIFFVISGFLVCGSLLRHRSWREFLRGRLFRVFPALVVMVALTVLLLGPLMTRLPLAEYFASKDVFKYFYKNATLLGGVSYKLPGVFEHNPYPLAVNGSLWTLPLELRMYGYLLGLWLLAGLLRARGEQVFRVAVLGLCAVAVLLRLHEHFFAEEQGETLRLLAMFFFGAALCLEGGRLLRSAPLCLGLAAALVALAFDQRSFFVAYTLALPCIVLYLAQAQSGPLLAYNRLGDYSYGVYLYAFPVQQLLAALVPGIGVWEMVGLASAGTLALAVCSWHLVEKPALDFARERRRRARQSAAAEATAQGA